jgi:CheY-like chemotaxis protein
VRIVELVLLKKITGIYHRTLRAIFTPASQKHLPLILVIEPDKGMRGMMISVLEQRGYDVHTADDELEMKAFFKNHAPQLVFLDIHISHAQPDELLDIIHRLSAEAKIILTVGLDDIETLVPLLKQKYTDYIIKPFNIETLLTLAAKAMPDAVSAAKWRMPLLQKIHKYILFMFIIAGLFVELLLLTDTISFARSKKNIFLVPYSNPTAVTFDGTYLWVSDWVTQTFFKHTNDKKLSIAQIYTMPDSHPTGIAHDGTYFWASNSWEYSINKYREGSSLELVQSYESPGNDPSGLFWDGAYLWICDLTQGKIYQTKPTETELEIVSEHELPGIKPASMFQRNGYFWIADAETNNVFKMDPAFNVVTAYRIPYFTKNKIRLSSVCWGGDVIWACSDQSSYIVRGSESMLHAEQQ